MFAKTKETKTPKYALLTVLIALAVLISLAAAEKANADDRDIKSIEYKQSQASVELSVIDDPYWTDYTGGYFFNAGCDPELYETEIQYEAFHTYHYDSLEPYFFKDDKLIITYMDGSTRTLSPRFAYVFTGGGSGEYEYVMAWVDEKGNVTDVITYIHWDLSMPESYYDKNTGVTAFKKGTYNHTATVEIGRKKTTFTKKFIFKGNVASYDKTLPVINYKKIKTGFEESKKKGKNTILSGFSIDGPKNKNNDLFYGIKIKMIYPESLESSKYEKETIVRTDYNYLDDSSYDNPGITDLEWTDGHYLTADTMMEISMNYVKCTDPEKTGAEFAYGKFSKPARFFLSKNKTLKAKGKKKSVRLTWSKVYRATGYKIKYSTKKNMSKAKTIKVKGGNKKAYTIKKLKKNKKYYFQITPYKVYKGKTYTGYASAKKAAKAK